MSQPERVSEAVVLVGHGAPATDCPPELVARLKRLESERRRARQAPSDEERALDARVRSWPRTAHNDPYREGVLSLGAALAERLSGAARVVVAFNEFCAPSLEDVVRELAASAAMRVTVVPTMLTKGGVHSELEIPEALEALRAELPHLELRYAWPFDEAALAAVLAEHIARSR